MEKKHYILIGALALVLVVALFVNFIHFGKTNEKINLDFKEFKADTPQKSMQNINVDEANENSEQFKIYTTCSS